MPASSQHAVGPLGYTHMLGDIPLPNSPICGALEWIAETRQPDKVSCPLCKEKLAPNSNIPPEAPSQPTAPAPAKDIPPTGIPLFNIEQWREYDFGGRVYRINSPVQLFIGKTCHRILDASGIVHCVPAPGFHGCVLRWKAKDNVFPVAF